MPEQARFYRIHDWDKRGVHEVNLQHDDTASLNQQGWGIFHTVNFFKEGGGRTIENLSRIRAWYVDIDGPDKNLMRERIKASPLEPTAIVETKNGFHLYWFVVDATTELYRKINLRLVNHYDGDRNATDLARVLRTPGFMHMKNPRDPFFVGHPRKPNYELVYTERMMLDAYAPHPDEAGMQKARPAVFVRDPGDNLWERIYNLDQEEALRRVSGWGVVGGEIYTFSPPTRRGTLNIRVNGKQSSCWIDERKRIGSRSKGGPTIYDWLRWFGHSTATCLEIVKDLFPELDMR